MSTTRHRRIRSRHSRWSRIRGKRINSNKRTSNSKFIHGHNLFKTRKNEFSVKGKLPLWHVVSLLMFLLQRKSSELLIKKIKSLDNYHHIYIDCWQLGYEELWREIVVHFNKKVHVSEERYNLYCTGDPSFADVLTTDASSTRFHSCNWESECSLHGKYTMAFHPIPTINNEVTPLLDNTKLLRSDLPYRAELKQHLVENHLPDKHFVVLTLIRFYLFLHTLLVVKLQIFINM